MSVGWHSRAEALVVQSLSAETSSWNVDCHLSSGEGVELACEV